jgi:hypothetical protein
MSSWKLMGSAGSIDDLVKLINQKLGWVGVHAVLSTGELKINGEKVDGLRVIKKGTRYRLERIES